MTTEREKSPKRGMCAAVLTLEAIAFGLTTPVMVSVSDVSLGAALAVGLGLMVASILVAGMLRRPGAYYAGFVLQAWAVGLGFVVPIMFFLGGVFALLYGTAYFLGRRIEQERAAAFAAFDEHDG